MIVRELGSDMQHNNEQSLPRGSNWTLIWCRIRVGSGPYFGLSVGLPTDGGSGIFRKIEGNRGNESPTPHLGLKGEDKCREGEGHRGRGGTEEERDSVLLRSGSSHTFYPISPWGTMAAAKTTLSQKEADIQMMLAADVHLGTKNCDFQMERYVFKRRTDGMLFTCPSQLHSLSGYKKLYFTLLYILSSLSGLQNRSNGMGWLIVSLFLSFVLESMYIVCSFPCDFLGVELIVYAVVGYLRQVQSGYLSMHFCTSSVTLDTQSGTNIRCFRMDFALYVVMDTRWLKFYRSCGFSELRCVDNVVVDKYVILFVIKKMPVTTTTFFFA